MGKRSTNTTKSGKFMNPTDQARKEARRKELKKNKKQRLLVRTAVIKGKNPTDIILELEKLDDMEYNVLAAPPLNEKVMREKRRKLMETWNRVIHLYEKEDVDQHIDLKKLWYNYIKRKEEVMDHFDAVKTAQTVDVEEIPLPSLPEDGDGRPGDIPLPPILSMQAKAGILKKSSVLDTLRPRSCPGVPAGPPPSLSDYDEEGTDTEAVDVRSKKIRFAADDEGGEEDISVPGEEKGPKVDTLQRKMLAMSGQDVDAYMKEMEEVHKKTEAEKAVDLRQRMARLESNQPGPPGEGFVQMHPPAGFMMRPPLRPGMPPPGVRLPPGPPPGRPQLPPGPPPGRPPFMGQQRPPMRPGMRPHMPRPLNPPQSVVSAGPQLNAPSSSGASTSSKSVKTGSVIEAKPQMRNLLSDVTRFVPTNVKVKREGQGLAQGKRKQLDPMREVFAKHTQPQPPQKNKDDAYAQFMAEMEKMM
jgi:WW domain-binding protein 11